MISGRRFLCEAPNLGAISWEICYHEANDQCDKPHWYAKFSIVWGSTLLGIHSYAYHYDEALPKFIDKIDRVCREIGMFGHTIKTNSAGNNFTMLNSEETPFSGSIYWMRDDQVKLKHDPVSVFEIASCTHKIRLHAKMVGGEEKLVRLLGNITDELMCMKHHLNMQVRHNETIPTSAA